MSANRKRNGGMKRAYLKRFSSEMVNAGRALDATTMREYRRRASSPRPGIDVPEVQYRKLPMDHPRQQRIIRWLGEFNQDIKWNNIILVDTNFRTISTYFSSFGDDAVYYFEQKNKLTGESLESFTVTRATAKRIMANDLKGIVWKERGYAVGT